MNSGISKRLNECSGLTSITGTTLGSIQSKTLGNVSEILNLTSYRDEQYEGLISTSTDGKAIKSMLRVHSYIWQNIKFKYKDYTNKLVQIREESIWIEKVEQENYARTILTDEIIKMFMKPSAHNPFLKKEKKEILSIIKTEIIDNESLQGYIEGQSINSFIEYSNAKLKNLSERTNWGGFWFLLGKISGRTLKESWSEESSNTIFKGVKGYVGRILSSGNQEESPIQRFNGIFEEVIDYANRIYHIDIYTSLPAFKKKSKKDGFKDFDTVGTILRDAMMQWWTPYRDATFFIKILYAWGDLPKIKEAQKEAIVAQDAFFIFLNSQGGKCEEENRGEKTSKKAAIETKETIHREFTYTYTFENGKQKKIKITSRVKSVESILIKLFADEHYGDIDALNDLLGIRMFLGELDNDEKTEIIHHFGKFMGKNSAIFKNKWYLDNNQFDALKERWKTLNSVPIGIESRLKGRSSLEYKDCKYSGYLLEKIHKNQVGTEVQFFDTEDEPNPTGVAHHSILDAKKIIQWWYRGAHIITGKQISEVIRLRCFREDNSWLEFGKIFQEIYTTLVPYVEPAMRLHDDAQIAFAVKGYEELIHEEFPSMAPLHIDNYELFLIYIGQLGRDFAA